MKERNGYASVVMIGDGATDMEACPPAEAFIGNVSKVVLLRFAKQLSKNLRRFKLRYDRGGGDNYISKFYSCNKSSYLRTT